MQVLEHYVMADYDNRKLKFCYSTKGERIRAILTIINEFLCEGHIDLDVRGRNVVDIGAYIGDTPIYFALNGARHVYAFEPYPYSCRMAKKNVLANGLAKRITMINAGCGGSKGSMTIRTDEGNLAGSALEASGSGKTVQIMPLNLIVDKYRLKDAALKIDCEGCEYDILLKSKNDVLRRFSGILIEYHYGYAKLVKRLEEAGFVIRHIEQEHAMKNMNVENKEMHGGTLVATRK